MVQFYYTVQKKQGHVSETLQGLKKKKRPFKNMNCCRQHKLIYKRATSHDIFLGCAVSLGKHLKDSLLSLTDESKLICYKKSVLVRAFPSISWKPKHIYRNTFAKASGKPISVCKWQNLKMLLVKYLIRVHIHKQKWCIEK